MKSRGGVRAVFVVGFVLLLVDGAGAIWLGQISGRSLLAVVGVVLVLAAGGLVLAWRRWLQALEAVEQARRELHREIALLRGAASGRRDDGDPF